MTAKKIMELLLQGKKLRSIKWNKTEYVCLDKQGNLVDEAGNIHSLYLLSCIDELKEYIEYVDFVTALDHMLNGGKAKRLAYGENVKLHCDSDGIILDENNYKITLYRRDYITKDWILL